MREIELHKDESPLRRVDARCSFSVAPSPSVLDRAPPASRPLPQSEISVEPLPRAAFSQLPVQPDIAPPAEFIALARPGGQAAAVWVRVPQRQALSPSVCRSR